MQPERIAYGIGERLRKWGVEFNERDVAAFAKGLLPLGDYPDFDTPATRSARDPDRPVDRILFDIQILTTEGD
jgi:hypothetical protein